MSGIKSLESIVKKVTSLTPVTRAAGTANGTAFDAKGMGDILVTQIAGVATATGTGDVTIQDSADNSTFAAIAGATFPQVVAALDDRTWYGVLRKGSYRRYVRASLVVGTDNVIVGVDLFGFAPQDSELAGKAAGSEFEV